LTNTVLHGTSSNANIFFGENDKKEKKNETFTMKLTAAQLKKLHSTAKKKKITASEVIRQWIEAA
jgi:tryptophan synthase beta subunit